MTRKDVNRLTKTGRPFIGPCRDPLFLWFLQWTDERGTWRRYYADRTEARAALRQMKAAR